MHQMKIWHRRESIILDTVCVVATILYRYGPKTLYRIDTREANGIDESHFQKISFLCRGPIVPWTPLIGHAEEE